MLNSRFFSRSSKCPFFFFLNSGLAGNLSRFFQPYLNRAVTFLQKWDVFGFARFVSVLVFVCLWMCGVWCVFFFFLFN